MTVDAHDLLELERAVDRTLSSSAPGVEPTPEEVRHVVARSEELCQRRYAVGIELLPYRAVAVLTGEIGDHLAETQRSIPAMTVETVVSTVAQLVDELVTEQLGVGLPRRVVVGIHLAGPVDARTGTVLFYSKHPPDSTPDRPSFQWTDVPLGRLIEKATGLATAVENDANSLAMFQQWFGVGREVSRFGLILLRDGVGGSLVLNGELFDGPFEIGNLVVYPEGGRVCDCGNQGCLEATAGGYGIVEVGRILTGREVGTAVEVAELVEQSSEAGAKAMDAFKAAGIGIAKALGFVATLAAPTRMVLYAPPFMLEAGGRAADVFLAEVGKFKHYVSHAAYRDCQLVVAPLRPYEGAQAAAVVALRRCYGSGPAPTPAIPAQNRVTSPS